MDKRLFFICLVISIVVAGCSTSFINWNEMKLDNVEYSSQIPNLQRVGSNTQLDNEEIERFVPQFFDTTTAQMGFYSVSLSYTPGPTTGGIILTLSGAPIIYIWTILGVPFTIQEYTCFARLRIFDSNGNMVDEIITKDKFSQVIGIYYGGDRVVTEKAGKKYSKILKEAFDLANKNSDKINKALNSSGKLSDDQKEITEATTKIRLFNASTR